MAIYKDEATKHKHVVSECLIPPNAELMSVAFLMPAPWFPLRFLYLSSTLLFSLFLLSSSFCLYFTLSCVIQFERVLVCNLSQMEYGPDVIMSISSRFPERKVCVSVCVYCFLFAYLCDKK